MNTRVRLRRLAVVAGFVLASGCGRLTAGADAKFGDQHFKTAVALVELYHVRHGTYPTSLAALDFVGEWDAIALSAVQYQPLASGYELNVTRGWVARPELRYPPEFWHGLGLRKTNVGGFGPAT
jgi:hypothetical protein